MFRADQPITECSEDKLDRTAFAESLGKAILSYKSKECIVLGLFGSWGTGKTSLLNMCVECINQATESYKLDEKPIIIKFNPWYYSGQQQLIFQFFNNISLVLRQSAYAEGIQKIGDQISDFAKSLPFELSEINLRIISLKHKKKSLEKEKDKICKLLENQNQKIIVIIDDIDRLNNDEIRQMFQLIKILGNLPNIIYLVAFDKKIVIKAIEKEQKGSGLEYLEKIVQVPFEIPIASKDEIEKLLFAYLYELIKDIPEDRWDITYWGNIFHSGMKVFFQTIRDVTRYINSLRFSLPMVQDEVNPIDFIAITYLQVFLPDLYYSIRDNKKIFAGAAEIYPGRPESVVKQEKTRCDEILNIVPKNLKENIKELLIFLFPKLESIWGNTNWGHDWLGTWRKKCRICHPDIFGIYFKLAIPKGEISQKEINDLLALGSDSDKFSEQLLRFNRDGRISRVLDRLEDYTKDTIPVEHIKHIITALINVADTFPKGKQEFWGFDNHMRVSRILYQLIHRLKSQSERFDILKHAIEKADSLYVIAREISTQDQEHDKNSKEPLKPEEERTVTQDQLLELESLVLKKIELWANNSRLSKHPQLAYILFRWARWRNKEVVVKYIETLIKEDKGLIAFITSFLSQYQSWQETDYVTRDHWELHIEGISEFIEISNIEPKVREIIKSEKFNELDEKEKLALQLFIDKIDGKIQRKF